MAAAALELTAPGPPTPPAADYPALFGDYVVRGAVALCARLTAPASRTADEFARLRDHALHLLTFALEPDAAWPAARDLLLALAEPMEQAGARSAWLPFLTRGVERSVALRDCAAEAELTLRCGHLLRLVSDFTTAQTWLARADRCFAARDDRRGVARVRNQQAYLACLQHRDEAAVTLADAALALLAAEDDERAMSYFVLGMVAINRWQWEEAEQHHRATLAIRARQDDRRRVAWAQQNIGYALQGQRRYAEAIACFEAAAAALAGLDDQANRAIVLMNLARTYHLDGQLDDALATGQAARLALHAVGDRFHSAGHLLNLGLIHLARHEPRAALEACLDAVALYTALDDAPGRLNATSAVAMALLALEDHAAVVATLTPALDELAPLDNVPGKEALLRAMRENLARAEMQIDRGFGG
jgi:tetratricopeptide (TPR) repeat protein